MVSELDHKKEKQNGDKGVEMKQVPIRGKKMSKGTGVGKCECILGAASHQVCLVHRL